jgi:hypothetical protein
VKLVVDEFPESNPEIMYGLECFIQVSPHPILEAALSSAREEQAKAG